MPFPLIVSIRSGKQKVLTKLQIDKRKHSPELGGSIEQKLKVVRAEFLRRHQCCKFSSTLEVV